MNEQLILKLTNVGKSFAVAGGKLTILEKVSFDIKKGEKVAIIGPSGSGKSTLLSLLGLLDSPSVGTIEILGQEVGGLSEQAKAKFRNEVIGFVFQSFELIAPFTVKENVSAPLDISGQKAKPELVSDILAEVGLTERSAALPNTLSGGEKQRVAIARALVHKPAILLADEPTGSLDRETGEKVLKFLLDAVTNRETTLLVITHDEAMAAMMDRIFEIKEQTVYERR